jgi:tetratricopeptide (TPR) repeat protein
MNYLLLSILLWIWDNRSFETIEANNRAKVVAEQAYQQQNYQLAIVGYQKVLSSSLLIEPTVRLNLANALFKSNKLKEAQQQYRRLAILKNTSIASQAQMQLGLIEAQQKDTAAALISFKKSLQINPGNDIARFDFELLKSQYSSLTPTNKPPKINSKPQNAKTEQETANVQMSESEQKKDLLKRLNSMKMTEAQATMILDAMQTSEIQYLQQRQKTTTNQNKGRW